MFSAVSGKSKNVVISTLLLVQAPVSLRDQLLYSSLKENTKGREGSSHFLPSRIHAYQSYLPSPRNKIDACYERLSLQSNTHTIPPFITLRTGGKAVISCGNRERTLSTSNLNRQSLSSERAGEVGVAKGVSPMSWGKVIGICRGGKTGAVRSRAKSCPGKRKITFKFLQRSRPLCGLLSQLRRDHQSLTVVSKCTP